MNIGWSVLKPIRKPKRSSERGASLVEAAFVTPLFFAMIFFLFEMGLYFRGALTTENASREGARAASVRGDEPDADYLILRSVEHGLEAVGLRNLDYVVVFKAAGPDAVVPPGCHSASRPDVCNRYTAADFFAEINDGSGRDTGNFRCGKLDRHWCPTTRDTSLDAGTDYVGVYVQTRHDFVTNFFPGGATLAEHTIMSLEPED